MQNFCQYADTIWMIGFHSVVLCPASFPSVWLNLFRIDLIITEILSNFLFLFYKVIKLVLSTLLLVVLSGILYFTYPNRCNLIEIYRKGGLGGLQPGTLMCT